MYFHDIRVAAIIQVNGRPTALALGSRWLLRHMDGGNLRQRGLKHVVGGAFRQTEVAKLHVAIKTDEHIAGGRSILVSATCPGHDGERTHPPGLQVSVNHSLSVDMLQRRQQLAEDAQRLAPYDHRALPQPVAERGIRTQRHLHKQHHVETWAASRAAAARRPRPGERRWRRRHWRRAGCAGGCTNANGLWEPGVGTSSIQCTH